MENQKQNYHEEIPIKIEKTLTQSLRDNTSVFVPINSECSGFIPIYVLKFFPVYSLGGALFYQGDPEIVQIDIVPMDISFM